MAKPTRDELRAEWIAALRSGNYTQTEGRLRHNNSYCCLGVAAAIAHAHGLCESPRRTPEGDYEYETCHGILPCHLVETFGLRSSYGDHVSGDDDLTQLNDTERLTFPQIADKLDTGQYWAETKSEEDE